MIIEALIHALVRSVYKHNTKKIISFRPDFASLYKQVTIHSSLERESMKKNTQKSATQDLIKELHSKCKTASDTQSVTRSDATKLETKVEQKKEQKEKQKEKQQVKLRDVKEFIKTKTADELSQDSRVVIKERRNYMLHLKYMKSATADETYDVFNATMYRDANNELQLFSQELANKFVQEYVQKLEVRSKFTAQDIMKLHSTCGGAYGDKIRNALYSISQLITEDQLNSLTDSDIKAIQQKNKCCVYFNVISDSRRARYNFVKIV